MDDEGYNNEIYQIVCEGGEDIGLHESNSVVSMIADTPDGSFSVDGDFGQWSLPLFGSSVSSPNKSFNTQRNPPIKNVSPPLRSATSSSNQQQQQQNLSSVSRPLTPLFDRIANNDKNYDSTASNLKPSSTKETSLNTHKAIVTGISNSKPSEGMQHSTQRILTKGGTLAPPLVVFKEPWRKKEERIQNLSNFGNLPGWRLVPIIVKSGDDLRQEQCASQLIHLMHHLLQAHASCEFWLKPYDILALSPDSGIIEAVPDTVSLDVLRKSDRRYTSLMNFFETFFGMKSSQAFSAAQHNFIVSLATYCIVCYILSLKDRHNGNILIDNTGHIIHIDFGFILGTISFLHDRNSGYTNN
jgi:hypothetical protein